MKQTGWRNRYVNQSHSNAGLDRGKLYIYSTIDSACTCFVKSETIQYQTEVDSIESNYV